MTRDLSAEKVQTLLTNNGALESATELVHFQEPMMRSSLLFLQEERAKMAAKMFTRIRKVYLFFMVRDNEVNPFVEKKPCTGAGL